MRESYFNILRLKIHLFEGLIAVSSLRFSLPFKFFTIKNSKCIIIKVIKIGTKYRQMLTNGVCLDVHKCRLVYSCPVNYTLLPTTLKKLPGCLLSGNSQPQSTAGSEFWAASIGQPFLRLPYGWWEQRSAPGNWNENYGKSENNNG